MNFVIPITAFIAIFLFISREILDLIKTKRKKKNTRSSIKLILKYEFERNFWSLKNLFQLWESLRQYESLKEIKLDLQKGIENNYSITVHEKSSQSWFNQALPPFYFDRFEKSILAVSELGSVSFEKIQNAYSALRELENLRNITLNLFAGVEWDEHPDISFNFLQTVPEDYDKYYEILNCAYFELSGTKLESHRLN